MTILYIIQKPQFRGAEIFTSQLASHMQQCGHRTIMVYLFPGGACLPFEGKIINAGGTCSKRWWDIHAWRRLAAIIKQEQPDIVQANAGDTLKYAVSSKLFFRWKQPIIFRNASMISLYIHSWPVKLWNGCFFYFTNKIISVSHASAKDFAMVYPGLKNKITVVPIGIEATATIPECSTLIKDDQTAYPLLMHVGGFTHEKNHRRLISIFQALLEEYPNASLHLVGDGPLKKQMEELVKAMGLGNHVLFYGTRNDVNQLITIADVLVLPSIIEGLPGIILEAFYHKIPVVAYDVGGIKEVLKNKETGRLVKKNDEPAFVAAVCGLLENETERKRMIENAYQLVCDQYLNKMVTQQFLAEYELLLGCRQELQITG